MTSPYVTKPMASTVELQMREGCKSYDLYISSELRRSMFMTSSSSKDDTTVRLSMLNMMYSTDKTLMINSLVNLKNNPKQTAISRRKQ